MKKPIYLTKQDRMIVTNRINQFLEHVYAVKAATNLTPWLREYLTAIDYEYGKALLLLGDVLEKAEERKLRLVLGGQDEQDS